ncbi:hypothetical protein SMICM17S_10535 [Streptomyces microflavus]
MRRASPTPPVWRLPGSRVSCSHFQTTRVSTMPTPVRTTKMPRQSVKRITCPPISGAMIGATPEISIRVEKNRAISTPSYRSRTTARAITMPAAPASPWRRRKPMRSLALGASAQIAVAMT